MSILIQFLILLTIQEISAATAPLKCFFRGSEFSNDFRNINIQIPVSDMNKISPLRLDPIRIGDTNSESNGLQLITRDVEYFGFDDAIIDEISINYHNNVTRLMFHSDIKVKCYYKITGSLLGYPAVGEGDFNGLFRNLKIGMLMPFEIVSDEKNRKYVDLKTFYYFYETSDIGEIQYNGLYNGDKQKSQVVHSLINQNLKIFSMHVGKPFFEKMVGQIFNVFRNYMMSLSLRDISVC